eukprot:TRINITY_DN23473_c0_g1_i3.p1 TRINITY_DN23473_c0_g1~~TRINITY_DN23473_c0_g1_i3.p1  ORF type:complete len:523 (+),score=105.61 TRINITY_DN23473_c0_g1_i3:415-1983(+)
MVVKFRYLDFEQFRDVQLARWEVHQSGLVDLFLYFVISMCGWLSPTRVTVRFFDVCHVTVIARICWQACTSDTVYRIFALGLVSSTARLLAALMMGTPALTLCLNMVGSAVKLWSFSGLFVNLDATEQNTVMFVWGGLGDAILREIFMCAATWCVASVMETWNYAAVRSNLELKKSSTSEGTVKSILSVMCDAVVEVDRDLRMTTASTELAKFLLRHPLNDSYKGGSLLEFVESPDRERVKERISTSSIGHGTTVALSTKLIDGSGTALNVQMYCTCFIGIDDCRAYVIGILEVKDPQYLNSRADTIPLEDSASAGSFESLQGVRGSGALHAASEHTDSVHTSDSTDSEAVPLVTGGQDLELWIDLADSSLPVLAATPAITHMAGPECQAGESLLRWLKKPGEAEGLVRELSNAFDRFIANPNESTALAKLNSLHLQPPHARRAKLEYKVQANVNMLSLLEHGMNGGPVRVCLEFDNVCVKKARDKKKSEKKRKRARSSSSSQSKALEASSRPSAATDVLRL